MPQKARMPVGAGLEDSLPISPDTEIFLIFSEEDSGAPVRPVPELAPIY